MYYSIVCDVNYSNGCFDQQINWIPSDFIGCNHEKTGYIVQKIKRQLNASDEFINEISKDMDNYRHEYFEAWEVVNGSIQLEADYGFQDQWKYTAQGYYGMLDDFRTKYLTRGEVKMTGQIYWIDKGKPEYIAVKRELKKGTVKQAGELLSAYKFDAVQKLRPTHTKEKSGSWDFMDDKRFIEAVIDYTRKGKKCHKEWIDDICKYFNKMPLWQQIVNEIYKMKL